MSETVPLPSEGSVGKVKHGLLLLLVAAEIQAREAQGVLEVLVVVVSRSHGFLEVTQAGETAERRKGI